MGERMTSIHLPGLRHGAGIAEYGRKAPAEMVAQLRMYAESQKSEAEAILAADEADFRVETYTGVHVQRNREILQDGRPSVVKQSLTTEATGNPVEQVAP